MFILLLTLYLNDTYIEREFKFSTMGACKIALAGNIAFQETLKSKGQNHFHRVERRCFKAD